MASTVQPTGESLRNSHNDSQQLPVMTPNTRRKLQQLANQLNVQVEEIEKPPYEINDNTDDIMEPQPAALLPQATMSVRSSKGGP
jgi:hypothetical protein